MLDLSVNLSHPLCNWLSSLFCASDIIISGTIHSTCLSNIICMPTSLYTSAFLLICLYIPFGWAVAMGSLYLPNTTFGSGRCMSGILLHSGYLFLFLQILTALHGQDHILMECTFPSDYPNKPFFLRIISPRMSWYTGESKSLLLCHVNVDETQQDTGLFIQVMW